MPSGPRPRGRWAVSRQGELDSQPDGLDHDWDPITVVYTLTYTKSDGGGDSAGNTEGNIDLT